MTARRWFGIVAAASIATGTALWWVTRPEPVGAGPPAISTGALWSASFSDPDGRPHTLGELQGKVVVVNFWATWCAPCREEMPLFSRLHESWKGRGVQFVGLANDDPAKVMRFGRDHGISYPLWVGGEAVSDLSRRLGNRLGVLPHTVILGREGQVVDSKVGPYTEAELVAKLSLFSAN